MVKISASVLSKHDLNTILKISNTDTDYLHIDVMDGLFVPNKVFSTIDEIKQISQNTSKPLDIHLMVNDVESYLNQLDLPNISFITLHYEVLKDLNIINKIQKKGIKCGLSIKPNTEVREIYHLLDKIDLVLIMSVEPGFGGQLFLNDALDKISLLKEEIQSRHLKTLISVDGGINESNAHLCRDRGADILVPGVYITDSDNPQEQINTLR